MDLSKPDLLTITDVSQQNDFISFTIGEQDYMLTCSQLPTGKWTPINVRHKFSNQPTSCPFCGEPDGTQCSTFTVMITPLFHHLITFNAIRLIWVCREIQ